MSPPAEPYVAVIFTSQLGTDPDGYAETADEMERLASEEPGFLGIDSARSTDGFGITVSYWRNESDARRWKHASAHLAAQRRGKSSWYRSYRVRVAVVGREYSYDASVEIDTLLHLALPDDWYAARRSGEYRISTRGRTLEDVGFIHCSYAHQLNGVANRFYHDLSEVMILSIDPELLDAEVRVEPSVEDPNALFPHIYGPLPTSAVLAATWWERGADGVWHRPTEL